MAPPGKQETAGRDAQRVALEIAAAGSPDPDRLIRIRVAGRSMTPVLEPGDDILVTPVPAGDIGIGDIITFLDESGPLTHRVVGEARGAFLTKGDFARAGDPPVASAAVIGRAVRREAARGNRDLATGPRERLLARVSAAEGRFDRRRGRGETQAEILFSRIVHRLFRVTIRILAGV